MTGDDLLTAPSPPGRSWRDDIKVHPAADVFPMMSDDELDELAADIAKNGVQQPIVWLKDQLLDGRNRVAAVDRIPDEKRRDEILAAWQNGKNCIVFPFQPDPYGYVASANLHRRHLTAEQRREVTEKLVKAQPEKSDRAIAKMAKVSDKTVGAVRAKLEAGAEIPHHKSRVGADGVAQPATKPKTTPADPSPGLVRAMKAAADREAAVMGGSSHIAAPKARTSRGLKAEARLRAQAKIGFAALLHEELADTLEEVVRVLRNERTQIAEQIPLQKRVVLARGCMMALSVSLEDLRPIEAPVDNRAATASPAAPLAAAPTEPKPAKAKPDLGEKIVAALKAMPGLSRTALNAKTHAYGSQIDQAIETGLIVERDGALFARGAA
jgi:hypothetical protein